MGLKRQTCWDVQHVSGLPSIIFFFPVAFSSVELALLFRQFTTALQCEWINEIYFIEVSASIRVTNSSSAIFVEELEEFVGMMMELVQSKRP